MKWLNILTSCRLSYLGAEVQSAVFFKKEREKKKKRRKKGKKKRRKKEREREGKKKDVKICNVKLQYSSSIPFINYKIHPTQSVHATPNYLLPYFETTSLPTENNTRINTQIKLLLKLYESELMAFQSNVYNCKGFHSNSKHISCLSYPVLYLLLKMKLSCQSTLLFWLSRLWS